MNDNQRRHLLICECGQAEHTAIWTYWPDDEDDAMYLTYHLSLGRPWYRRVVSAIQHILGRRSRYGDFGEIVLNGNNARPLLDFLNVYFDNGITVTDSSNTATVDTAPGSGRKHCSMDIVGSR